MNNELMALGVDIGGTNTKMGLFNSQGELKVFHSVSTAKDKSPEDFIEYLAQEFQLILSQKFNLSLGHKNLVGVGVGAPMANYFTGKVDYAPNLGWRNVPLKELFQNSFHCPVAIENDANLAAVGEKKWGVAQGLKDFILITLGTGVGTGLILNHSLYRGSQGLGGEGGHIIVPHHKNRLCSCGGTNHLESFLSAKGIKQTMMEASIKDWELEDLGKFFNQGDLRAQNIFEAIAQELATGLVSMAVLLGPEAIIIGGGVAKLGEGLNQMVKVKLDELVHYSLRGKIQILSARLSSDQGAVYGGAAHIFNEVLIK